MRSYRYLFLVLFLLFLLNACKTPYFIDEEFDQITGSHQTIAILPFEMIYTGLIPEDLNESDLLEIETAESKAFMISYFDEILRSTDRNKRALRVNIQPYRRTLNKLKEHQVSIQESWEMDPENLSKLLEVDAVVRACISKNRIMSDLASYGIEISIHIVDVLTDHSVWPWLPYGATTSKQIEASYYLYSKDNAILLWSISYQIDADWRSRSKDIIDHTNRRSAKHFPYRIRT